MQSSQDCFFYIFSPDLIYLAIRIMKVLSKCCVYFVFNKLLSLYVYQIIVLDSESELMP